MLPRRELVALGVLAATLFQADRAGAEVRGGTASGCPPIEALRERVRALLPSGVDAPEARVEVRSVGAGFEATIRVAGDGGEEGGERTLRGQTCEAVVEAAAVVLSVVAREAEQHEAPPIAQPAPSPTTPARPRAPVASPREVAPPPHPARDPFVALGASGGVLAGTLPSVAPVVEVRGGLLRRALRADLSVAMTPSQASETAPGVGGRFAAQIVSARACYAPAYRAVRGGLCAGLEVQRIVGEGYGSTRAFQRTAVAWGPELGVLGEWAITRALSIRGDLRAVAPVTRRAFVIEGVGTVARSQAVGVRALLGPEVRF